MYLTCHGNREGNSLFKMWTSTSNRQINVHQPLNSKSLFCVWILPAFGWRLVRSLPTLHGIQRNPVSMSWKVKHMSKTVRADGSFQNSALCNICRIHFSKYTVLEIWAMLCYVKLSTNHFWSLIKSVIQSAIPPSSAQDILKSYGQWAKFCHFYWENCKCGSK